MSIFKKIGNGLAKAAKAVGKGVGNAAKWTAKNAGKVALPALAIAGTALTAGALAPSLAPALAATKVGSTIFGKMVTKTMSTGTVVREKIVKTLKKNGKKATDEEVKTVETGLQEEIKKRKGHKLPVDKKSKSGTEARNKLKKISEELTNKQLSDEQKKIRETMNAERKVLIDNPDTNGILSKNDVPTEAYEQMKEAGSVKKNILGAVGSIFGGNAAAKAQDVLGIITGQDQDPYLSEDLDEGLEYIQARQNEASIVPQSVVNFLKKPIVLIAFAIGLIFFFSSSQSNSKKSKKNRR